MCIKELREVAMALPLAPGVYIMRDRENRVIYVGKAKKLKNRVSQYFQGTAAHSHKTKMMVAQVDHFEVIVAASEFEALVLECSLIKQHKPKYNILLKDDKGYPFIRLNLNDPYPRLSIVNTIADDGAQYFGPFGSMGITNGIVKTICTALHLPDCGRKFPRDIGKDRPCLNYHMNLCDGWCRGVCSQQEYLQRIMQAKQLLQGNYRSVSEEIKKQMLDAAETLNFELAASLRDRLNAVEALGKKQLVTAGANADVDIIGYGKTEITACFTVLHYNDGKLVDKEFQLFTAPEDDEAALSALIKQYYLSRGFAPKNILLPFAVEDADLFSQMIRDRFLCKTIFKVPQRGDNAHLVKLACTNAFEEAGRVTQREARTNATVAMLGKMLGIVPPRRIEAYDISNISGTDMVAAMVVFVDGNPRRSEYKRFKIRELENQDDYEAMRQVVCRRFKEYLENGKGFEQLPDLLLIDGGTNHANVALSVLQELEINIPVVGMVKDDRHRTRALVTPDGREIRIDNQQYVYSLIGNIQEETHRFAITYHRKLRSKRLKYSELDSIPGIGSKRKSELLKVFKSIKGIGAAQLWELERCLPKDVALAVFNHFQAGEEK